MTRGVLVCGWLMGATILVSGCSTTREVPGLLQAADGKAVMDKTDDHVAYGVSVEIADPPEVVWAALTDVTRWREWNSALVSIEGSIEQDGKVTLVVKDAPDQTFNLAVTTFSPPTEMVWEDGMPLGMFAGVRTYRLTRSDAGTTFAMQEVFSGGMLSMIEGSLPDFRKSFETFAQDLKTAAEAAASS